MYRLDFRERNSNIWIESLKRYDLSLNLYMEIATGRSIRWDLIYRLSIDDEVAYIIADGKVFYVSNE